MLNGYRAPIKLSYSKIRNMQASGYLNLDADNDAALKCGSACRPGQPHEVGSVENPRILPPIPMNNMYQLEFACDHE
ncbi:hypothetical protein NTGBS_40059 [Candidatus Nitrotoga sp. BS]|nr:hypothetical protein NTGBS_40059 [Candidatus Nitrotoga sp. BS]